ncbi:MAG: hypothetical protein MUC49_02305 [Raineya sp.]|jgi:hypothetical protein|nr:hypothetical protein [Raineya sp.]
MYQKKYFVRTNKQPCKIVLKVDTDTSLFFVGKCDKTKTVYFRREKPFQNTKRVIFYLPVSPDVLTITAKGKNPFKVDSIQVSQLPKVKKTAKGNDLEFINHVIEFCSEFKKLDEGIYTDDKDRYPIVLSNQIKDTFGKTQNTPARVSRKTGQIEVSKSKFNEYTLPMQVFVLLHERAHYALNTSDELECDLQALIWYLEQCFPQTEAMYANVKIFSGKNPEHRKRAKQILDYVKHYNLKEGVYKHGLD